MNRTIKALLTALAAWSLWSCDKTTSATGTSDDTHSSVSITGRVFTEESKPLGAVIVHLRHAGLTDTTNGDGAFSIKGAIPAAARAFAAVDTLDYLRDGTVVYSVGVGAWVDTLPDLFLVQRNISGSITAGSIPVASTVATLWNAKGDSIPLGLEWNTVSQNYSGFAWFRYTGGLDSFHVQVEAMDSAGRLLGKSVKLAFTSRAGDILLPTFSAGNALPGIILSGPLSLVRGDTARLRAVVTNSAVLSLAYQWRIGVGPWATSRTDTLLQVPNNLPGPNLTIHFRATRSDGIVGEDSLRIPVTGTPPKAAISTLTDSVGYSRAILVHFADSAPAGSRIVRRRIGAPWNVDVSGSDTSLTAPDSIGLVAIVYTVWTDLGDSASTTLRIHLVAGVPSGVRAWTDSSMVVLEFPTIRGSNGWTVTVSDSSFSGSGATIQVPWDSASIHVPRVSAAPRMHLGIRLNWNWGPAFVPEQSPETTMVVTCPPLKMDFEQFGTNPDNALIWLVQPTWVTYFPTVVYDSVLGSDAFRLTAAGAPWKGTIGMGGVSVSAWNGYQSISLRLRSSKLVKLHLSIDPTNYAGTSPNDLPSYTSLGAQGIDLGWNVMVDSTGTAFNLPFDSLGWFDGSTHPELPIDTVLAHTKNLVFSIVCTDSAHPCPAPSSTTVVDIDDIRFLR
jgi:hypothetical protein